MRAEEASCCLHWIVPVTSVRLFRVSLDIFTQKMEINELFLKSTAFYFCSLLGQNMLETTNLFGLNCKTLHFTFCFTITAEVALMSAWKSSANRCLRMTKKGKSKSLTIFLLNRSSC